MSNQHKNALAHALDQVRGDVEHYDIEVDAGERMIVWRGSVIPIKPGTTQRECIRILRGMIAAEKKLAAKEYQADHQEVLL